MICAGSTIIWRTNFSTLFKNVSDRLFEKRLQALSCLVAAALLDVGVAIKRRGMYHEKIGIITDADEQRVVFQGSANESPQGLLPDYNFESINVFRCWQSELTEYFEPYISGFERLWNKQFANTLVLEFPDAVQEHLIKIAKNFRLPDPDTEDALWERARSRQRRRTRRPRRAHRQRLPVKHSGSSNIRNARSHSGKAQLSRHHGPRNRSG